MYRSKLTGAYASINLDHIVHNYKEASKRVGEEVTVTCVVKSDAYGHGEEKVVRALMDSGLEIVCVSTMIEAIRLRKKFPNLDILILGYTPSFLAKKTSEHNLIQTISTIEEAKRLNALAKTKVHIKVNTGMNRLGFDAEDADLIAEVSRMKNIELCGIFTHFYNSDSADKSTTEEQFRKYSELLEALEKRQVAVGVRHVCNSGGIISHRHMHLDMVRVGIMLYGLYPSKETCRDDVCLKECMELRSYIASILEVEKGEGISYGHTFIADKDMTVATVNLGYSDGLFRHLSNVGEVIIGNERRRIVGIVCMNMFIVDITGMDGVAVEDEVIIFGRSDSQFISIEEVAGWAGTISYEVICRTGYSVPRVFIQNNEVIEIEENLLSNVEEVYHDCRYSKGN